MREFYKMLDRIKQIENKRPMTISVLAIIALAVVAVMFAWRIKRTAVAPPRLRAEEEFCSTSFDIAPGCFTDLFQGSENDEYISNVMGQSFKPSTTGELISIELCVSYDVNIADIGFGVEIREGEDINGPLLVSSHEIVIGGELCDAGVGKRWFEVRFLPTMLNGDNFYTFRINQNDEYFFGGSSTNSYLDGRAYQDGDFQTDVDLMFKTNFCVPAGPTWPPTPTVPPPTCESIGATCCSLAGSVCRGEHYEEYDRGCSDIIFNSVVCCDDCYTPLRKKK